MSKVTEFARIKLKPGYDVERLRNSLLSVLDLQDNWVATNQPSNHRPGAHVSAFYIDISTEERPLMISARWDSRADHHEWIASSENHICNTALSEFQTTDGPDSVLLFHMMAAGARAAQLADANLRGPLMLHRIAAKDDHKERLAIEYRKLEEKWTNPREHCIWAGWKLERTAYTGRLVVFTTTAVTETDLRPLLDLATDVQVHQLEQII